MFGCRHNSVFGNPYTSDGALVTRLRWSLSARVLGPSDTSVTPNASRTYVLPQTIGGVWRSAPTREEMDGRVCVSASISFALRTHFLQEVLWYDTMIILKICSC